MDDARIHFVTEGTQGPFVIFLHGALAAGAAFRGQLPSLRDRFRLVLVDQRGHGRSSRFGRDVPWETLSVERYAADALALADLLSPQDPVHLVGASMGGLVAARLAEISPERVGALCLLSTPAGPDERWQRFFATTQPEELPKATQRLAATWHGGDWQELTRRLFAHFANPPPDAFAKHPRPVGGHALVMQADEDELLDGGDPELWAARIQGNVAVRRAPGDHAFFADGRSGTQAANRALQETLGATEA